MKKTGYLARHHARLRVRRLSKEFSSLCARGLPAREAREKMEMAMKDALNIECKPEDVEQMHLEGLALGEQEAE